MVKEPINKDKIDQVCKIGFLKFLKTHEALNINSIDVPIENTDNSQGYCSVTPIYDTEKVISDLFELGQTDIIFNVNCQVNKRLGKGEYLSIDVSAFTVQGTLLKGNDTLTFLIGPVFFRENGL